MKYRIAILAALALGLVGCKQGLGERCQINADCASNHCSTSDPQICVGAGGDSMGDIDATVPAPMGMVAFSFLATSNTGLTANVTATITDTSIAATVPVGTDVTKLVATFSSTGASVTVAGVRQVSGVTPNNFTSPVVYEVTSLDLSTTQDYTVTVTVGSAAGP
ncbi:MAG TPA: hypothetical protein VFT22_06955 [Kofleriaceae bacterium]|nr:hypothetical protein [Kofleriaceae bacterium]